MRDKVFDILSENGFLAPQYESVFAAMGDILDAAAEHLQETAPHATKAIERLVTVANEVRDMDSFLERYDD
jgi:ABC-type transporter Mla subunit MlaD